MKEHKKGYIADFIFIIISILMWSAMYYRQCVIDNQLDYHAHNLFANLIVEGKLTLTYPLYHYATGLLALALGTDTLHSSIIVLVCLQIMSMYAMAALLKEVTGNCNSRFWLLLGAFMLNIVQPVFTYSIKPGYSSGNGLVSPTSLACKPFAILAILFFYKAYKENNWTVKRQLLLLTMLILSCLAKPMFAMAFVPAMGLLLFVDKIVCLKNKNIKIPDAIKEYIIQIWPLFITGIVLIVQYVMTTIIETPRELTEDIRLSADADTHIRFGFMYAWSMVVSNVYVSILFAYLFPLAVLIVWLIMKKRKNEKFISNDKARTGSFAKMCIYYGIVSFCYIAFLYQDNGAERDMNFRNCWILTFTMVYCLAYSVLWNWIRQHEFGNKLQKSGIKIKENWAIYLIILIFAFHLLFGLALIAKNILI